MTLRLVALSVLSGLWPLSLSLLSACSRAILGRGSSAKYDEGSKFVCESSKVFLWDLSAPTPTKDACFARASVSSLCWLPGKPGDYYWSPGSALSYLPPSSIISASTALIRPISATCFAEEPWLFRAYFCRPMLESSGLILAILTLVLASCISTGRLLAGCSSITVVSRPGSFTGTSPAFMAAARRTFLYGESTMEPDSTLRLSPGASLLPRRGECPCVL